MDYGKYTVRISYPIIMYPTKSENVMEIKFQ
jgi:hypothetical protein